MFYLKYLQKNIIRLDVMITSIFYDRDLSDYLGVDFLKKVKCAVTTQGASWNLNFGLGKVHVF